MDRLSTDLKRQLADFLPPKDLLCFAKTSRANAKAVAVPRINLLVHKMANTYIAGEPPLNLDIMPFVASATLLRLTRSKLLRKTERGFELPFNLALLGLENLRRVGDEGARAFRLLCQAENVRSLQVDHEGVLFFFSGERRCLPMLAKVTRLAMGKFNGGKEIFDLEQRSLALPDSPTPTYVRFNANLLQANRLPQLQSLTLDTSFALSLFAAAKIADKTDLASTFMHEDPPPLAFYEHHRLGSLTLNCDFTDRRGSSMEKEGRTVPLFSRLFAALPQGLERLAIKEFPNDWAASSLEGLTQLQCTKLISFELLRSRSWENNIHMDDKNWYREAAQIMDRALARLDRLESLNLFNVPITQAFFKKRLSQPSVPMTYLHVITNIIARRDDDFAVGSDGEGYKIISFRDRDDVELPEGNRFADYSCFSAAELPPAYIHLDDVGLFASWYGSFAAADSFALSRMSVSMAFAQALLAHLSRLPAAVREALEDRLSFCLFVHKVKRFTAA